MKPDKLLEKTGDNVGRMVFHVFVRTLQNKLPPLHVLFSSNHSFASKKLYKRIKENEQRDSTGGVVKTYG
jgi:hypothetical protein